MYNPIYYLTNHYNAYKSSKVASYWRIYIRITKEIQSQLLR